MSDDLIRQPEGLPPSPKGEGFWNGRRPVSQINDMGLPLTDTERGRVYASGRDRGLRDAWEAVEALVNAERGECMDGEYVGIRAEMSAERVMALIKAKGAIERLRGGERP